MAVVGAATVQLIAKTARFRRGMKQSRKSVGRFRVGIGKAARSVVSFGAKLAKIGTLGATVAAAGIGLLVRQQAKFADALGKTADKLGIAAEQLQVFQLAAKLGGVEAKTFDMALQRMTRRIAEAAKDTGEAKAALEELQRLGLAPAAQLAAMGTGPAFLAVADALAKVKSQSDQVRLAFKLFDSEGVAVINVARGGSKAINALGKEAQALGVITSRIDIKRIEMMNDAFSKIKEVVAAIGRSIASRIAPAMVAITNRTLEWVKEMGGIEGILLSIGRMVVRVLRTITGGLDAIFRAMKTVGLGIQGVIALIKENAIAAIRLVVSAIAKIPGQGIIPGLNLAPAVAKDLTRQLIKARAETDKIANSLLVLKNFRSAGSPFTQGLTGVLAFFDDLSKGLTKTAKATLKLREATFRLGPDKVAEDKKAEAKVLGAQQIQAVQAGTQAAIRVTAFATGPIGAIKGATNKVVEVLTGEARETQRLMRKMLEKLDLTEVVLT